MAVPSGRAERHAEYGDELRASGWLVVPVRSTALVEARRGARGGHLSRHRWRSAIGRPRHGRVDQCLGPWFVDVYGQARPDEHGRHEKEAGALTRGLRGGRPFSSIAPSCQRTRPCRSSIAAAQPNWETRPARRTTPVLALGFQLTCRLPPGCDGPGHRQSLHCEAHVLGRSPAASVSPPASTGANGRPGPSQTSWSDRTSAT